MNSNSNSKGFTDTSNAEDRLRLGRLYPVFLKEYDPAYEKLFAEEKAFLEGVFAPHVFRISHIGSTAVKGLVSKPTVDILAEIYESCDLACIEKHLLSLGYIVNRPENDIVMFIKGYAPEGYSGQTYHIHVRRPGDWGEPYFRDYLSENPAVAEEYAKLKKALAEKYRFDRDAYTLAKSAFVEKYTAEAREKYGALYMAPSD